MRPRTTLAALTLFFAGAALCLASDNPNMGTWKLNEAKSKLAPGASRNHTVVYAAAGDEIKITVDGTDKDGKATHNEWVGKFDGKDYPVTGDSASDMRSYKQVNPRKLEMTVSKGGKATVTGTIEVAHDGKTRTVHTKGTDASGKTVENHAVYDKE
jgi:hypothetical protein